MHVILCLLIDMIDKIKGLLLNDATLLFAATILVNGGNYLINLILGRVLGPEEFSEVSVIATGVLMLSFFAVGLQLTSAKYSATYIAEKNDVYLDRFINWLSKNTKMISIGLSIVLLLFSFQLQGFFHFNSFWPFIIIVVGIPFYFDFSISRGLMQGGDKFKNLAMTYLIEMAIRLIVTFVLVLIVVKIDGGWSTEAVSIGFLLSFIATFLYAKRPKSSEKKSTIENSQYRLIKKFILIIGVYELSQIMINNSDIMLVKHFFDNHEAGLYAALALIGRVVFFATWTIVTLLFPKVIQKEKNGESHTHLFWGSLLIVGLIGLAIIIACYLLGDWIIQLLFGNQFIEAAPYLWQYACATTMFACANVFAYYYMSLNKYLPVLFSVIAGLAQIILIWFFHSQILEVIWVQIYLMGALFFVMMLYYAFNNLLYTKENIEFSRVEM